jgi:hypothetical protein
MNLNKQYNMERTFILKKLPLLVIVSALVLTVTFAQSNAGNNKTSGNDTVPTKQKKVRDLDEALIELDKGEEELKRAMKEIDTEMIEREIREAMKKMDVDMAKMKVDIAKAMKEIDAVKINADIQKGLADMQKELKGVDAEKIKKEVAASMEKIDMQKMKEEMQVMKEVDMEKMRKELENIRPGIEKSLEGAKKEIERARKEITSYKNLVDALDKDGLLKKDQDYKVEYRDNQLTVNGKKLSAAETKKYSEHLSGKEKFTIQKEDDDFNIHNK